ncbi:MULTISPECIES: hypothetical protein [unclassified Paenibacillus]|uniref:hypothetical protein n=1 Tax=unclassified Paenibacillus TaxID=185978 RepID=UPI00115FB86E|nr:MULTISPECIES: hypothetical protein [unclassified Paenibacillus]
MNKNKMIVKAAYIQMRIYIWILLAYIAAGLVANLIVFLAIGNANHSPAPVAIGNMLSVILIMMAVVLPLAFFRKIINTGATRKEYYIALMIIYTLSAIVLSIINIVFLLLVDQLYKDDSFYFNILEIFHWDQFGIMGMFLYQFAAYMLLTSTISMLFSGIGSYVGLSLWVIVIAAIPISTSIASYRHSLADGLQTLLFNDSLFVGVAICLIPCCIFLFAGWEFTKRRTL